MDATFFGGILETINNDKRGYRKKAKYKQENSRKRRISKKYFWLAKPAAG